MADTGSRFLASLHALAKASQLAAQALSVAPVTAASAQARLLTLAGLTATCILLLHSVCFNVSAEALLTAMVLSKQNKTPLSHQSEFGSSQVPNMFGT